MWIRAGSSERWLDNRATFTNSFAVMSIVGYILGLGDRHPNNIVIDRTTGKLIHIDFGDCFETSIDRKKFPETVPFRCTRMLINCMEVAGVDGTYRVVCERVMEVLRLNRDSLMAVLEAFVHDPLFSWRLMADSPSLGNKRVSRKAGVPASDGQEQDRGKKKGGSQKSQQKQQQQQLYHGLSPASPLSSDSYSSEHEVTLVASRSSAALRYGRARAHSSLLFFV
jgi:FKBP12-rapamycin complex-associated protein